MISEDVLEIKAYSGEGYQPLIDFEAWRVAILNWDKSNLLENIMLMERHTQTDEVFVLLHGLATLFVGGYMEKVDGIQAQVMEAGKLYNVKHNTWHATLLGRDASVLIVENRDTGERNSEYCKLTDEQQRGIKKLCSAGQVLSASLTDT